MNMITFPPFVSIASQNQTVMNGELIELTSTITLGRFSDSIHTGRHYCQAQVEGVSSLLSPSNALTFTTNDSVLNFNPYRDSNLTGTVINDRIRWRDKRTNLMQLSRETTEDDSEIYICIKFT